MLGAGTINALLTYFINRFIVKPVDRLVRVVETVAKSLVNDEKRIKNLENGKKDADQSIKKS